MVCARPTIKSRIVVVGERLVSGVMSEGFPYPVYSLDSRQAGKGIDDEVNEAVEERGRWRVNNGSLG